MTCPKCGLESQADQTFCRACGARLRKTTQQLVPPEAVSDPGRTSAVSSNGKRDANAFVFWGFVIMMIGVAIGVVGKKLLHEDVITVAGVLTSLAGIFLVVYPYILPPKRKEGGSSPSSKPERLTRPQPTEYLTEGSPVEYVPSVTERTTDLLKNPVNKKLG